MSKRERHLTRRERQEDFGKGPAGIFCAGQLRRHNAIEAANKEDAELEGREYAQREFVWPRHIDMTFKVRGIDVNERRYPERHVERAKKIALRIEGALSAGHAALHGALVVEHARVVPPGM